MEAVQGEDLEILSHIILMLMLMLMLKHKCDNFNKTLWNPSGKRSLGFEIRAMSICWKVIHSVLMIMVMMVKMANGYLDNGHNDDHGDNGNNDGNSFSMK